MPYTKQADRVVYVPLIKQAVYLLENSGNKTGDINFLFSSILTKMFKNEERYENANKLIGVLECIKLELYRKHIAGYEDLKEKENGSIV